MACKAISSSCFCFFVFFACNIDCEEVNELVDKPTESSFSALPLHLQLSQPSSPAANSTRSSTPTISLVTGSAMVNPVVKDLALELLKVSLTWQQSLKAREIDS